MGELVEFYNGDRSSRYPNDSDMVSEGVPFINAGDLVSGRVKLDTANKLMSYLVQKYSVEILYTALEEPLERTHLWTILMLELLLRH